MLSRKKRNYTRSGSRQRMKRITSSTDLQEDSKKVVRTAKEKSWTQYGEKLCETCKTSPREFYKSVKAMRVRDEPFDPTTTINDINGEALHGEEEITKRWENYFKDLLNPSGVRAQGTQSRFNPSHPDHTEPTILESEVRKVVKTSPKGKAAGVDGITTEAIIIIIIIMILFL